MRRRGVLLCGVLSHDFNQSFLCNLSNRVIYCPWCCQQRPGRRFPSIFSGVMLLLPPIERTGVAGMDVTWEGIFQFCMLIAAVIALVLQVNNKEK